NSQRLTIGPTGLIGFASTTPYARLSLAGIAGDTTNLFVISTSTASATTTALTIDSNGNFALLNGANFSVGGNLAVSGTTAFTGSVSPGIGNNVILSTNASGVLV